MIATIESTNQQTMYDLCLMTYGTLDLLVKFCQDNGIYDINYVPPAPQTFQYDTSLITDQKTSNYSYSSTTLANGVSCPLPTGVTLILAYTTAASFSWTITSGTYQYAVTDGTAPVSWIDVDASLGMILIEGLEDTTNYTFWLRNKCSATSFSSITHIAFETADPPTCDIPVGLSLGATTDTTQVINWTPDATPGRRYKWVLNTTGIEPSTAISTGTAIDASLGVKNLTGLIAGTHYYFYLRSKCTTTDGSAWELIEFTTGITCTPPAGVFINNITPITAQIHWTPTAGIEIYLLTTLPSASPAPSPGSGTPHAANLGAAGIAGLTTGTAYKTYLQQDCGGYYSSFVVTPFTTT